MTTNTFSGAVLTLTDSSLAADTAEYVANTYFKGKSYQFTVTKSTPDHLPQEIRDRVTKQQAELGSGSEVLTVYPTA